MYKYFKELDNPNNFDIYLKKSNLLNNNIENIGNINLSNIDIDLSIFKDIKFIEMLSIGMNSNLPKQYMSYEEYMDFYDFFKTRDEDFEYSKESNKKINITSNDIYYDILEKYFILSNYLIDFFPSYKEKITKIRNKIKKEQDKIKKKSTILLENKNNDKHTFPNAWYITSSGYLYNTGGEKGHKEGNLVYPYNIIIRQALINNKKVPNINTLKQIKDIIERGYITPSEFNNYAHLIDELPTIMTPEVELEKEKYKRILEMSKEEYKKINYKDLPSPKRSYQRNIINLVIGHLSAEQDLYKSFALLNDSEYKSKNLKEIELLSNAYLPDILVRYCGFHKIESQAEKTICTSSIDKIDLFRDYLDNDWNIQIIPKIVYDKKTDSIAELDLNSYYIENYLNKKKKQYKDKILIKK